MASHRQTDRQRNARPKPRTTIVVVCCQHGREQILALELLHEEVGLLAVRHGRPASGPRRQHTVVVLVRPWLGLGLGFELGLGLDC